MCVPLRVQSGTRLEQLLPASCPPSRCRVERGQWKLHTRDGWQEKVCRCPALEIQGTTTAGGVVSQAAGRHFPGSEELKEDLGARVMLSIDEHSLPLLMVVRETLTLKGEMF